MNKETYKKTNNCWENTRYTYTASVWSELRKRPCSRFSRNTSELKIKTKIPKVLTSQLILMPHSGKIYKTTKCQKDQVPQHLSTKHTFTLSQQSRGHRRGSGKKSPVQTLGYVSCNSVHAESGTLRSGHSAKTPTAQTENKWCQN